MLDFKRLLDDADRGVLPALKLLGDLYLNGDDQEGIEPDINRAITYYDRAVDGGMVGAMLELGYLYCSGQHMEPDYKKGLTYYERAAELGDTTALGNLGMAYCQGYGVEKDEEKGFSLFLKAAEGGHAMAMLQVSEMYQNGIGVEQDMQKAAEWHLKAKEQKEALNKAQETEKEDTFDSQIQKAFEENLKFLSKDSMDVTFANNIFTPSDNIRQYVMGECEFKSGKIITADPLCYLKDPKSVNIKAKSVKPGVYPVQVAVMNTATAGLRIVGARLKITKREAVAYELAKGLVEKDGELKTTFAGFPVECGMACFCDEQAAHSYWRFLDKWYKEHKDENIYNDYFEELFAESYKQQPAYQREGGDLLAWRNPLDDSCIMMFASGLGDGFYTDYWGVDADGELCELIIIFMNPALFG